ncbi:general secretion pathway protein GspM [Geotalea sp. SG265]|uniref:general secretion pathway protein GspM n=1 Tax=Geotalea sp. SG265 TaxID=2922867 RepID=UPI001FAFEF66|nr:general secretion pathway protein GspM [Geotalea sp. SG265]
MKYLHLLMETVKEMDERTRLRFGMALAAVLILAVILSAINGSIKRLEKKRAAREADIAEMLILKARYMEANMGAMKLSNRLAATRPDDSPAKVVEEIGIKGKNTQVKPVKGEDRPGFVEDAAEVKVEGLTANEAVNLIYRLEKGTKPVVIKKALMKTRFDDPARLDLTLTVALIKVSQQGSR